MEVELYCDCLRCFHVSEVAGAVLVSVFSISIRDRPAATWISGAYSVFHVPFGRPLDP